jgi:hypothetical protein
VIRRRIVQLLDPVELTPRQLAQRRYQQSHKGKAAGRRYYAKKRQEPAYRAAACERVRKYDALNRPMRRVYKRTWNRARKAAQSSGRNTNE